MKDEWTASESVSKAGICIDGQRAEQRKETEISRGGWERKRRINIQLMWHYYLSLLLSIRFFETLVRRQVFFADSVPLEGWIFSSHEWTSNTSLQSLTYCKCSSIMCTFVRFSGFCRYLHEKDRKGSKERNERGKSQQEKLPTIIIIPTSFIPSTTDAVLHIQCNCYYFT